MAQLVGLLVSEDDAFKTHIGRMLRAGAIPVSVMEDRSPRDGVAADHPTETFAEIELGLDNWRWHGTTFRLRTGKALRRDRKEVAVHFRPVPHLPRGMHGDPRPNVLRLRTHASVRSRQR